MRITAQLIDATTHDHDWAERYDRELDDIFALQDEITKRVERHQLRRSGIRRRLAIGGKDVKCNHAGNESQ